MDESLLKKAQRRRCGHDLVSEVLYLLTNVPATLYPFTVGQVPEFWKKEQGGNNLYMDVSRGV